MRIAIVSTLLLVPALLEAQQRVDSPIRKGSVQVAGTADFVHLRDIGNDNGSTALRVMPRVAYFVIPGLAVSANLLFQKFWYETGGGTNWGIGPGLTYYFTTHSRKFFPFISGRTLFVRGSSHSDEHVVDGFTFPPSRSTTFTDSWLLSGGALFMISRQVGISTELFYQRDKFGVGYNSGESWNSSEMYGLQWGLAVFIF